MLDDPEQPEWFNKLMRSQQSESEPPVRVQPDCSVWPCWCGAKNWEDAGNKCKAGVACSADLERQNEYDKFVESMVPHCQCENPPCDGVLAGGICDTPNRELSEPKSVDNHEND